MPPFLSHLRSAAAPGTPAALHPCFHPTAALLTTPGLGAGVVARAASTIDSSRAFIAAFTPPDNKPHGRALDEALAEQFALLDTLRPTLPALENVTRWVRRTVAGVGGEVDGGAFQSAAVDAALADYASTRFSVAPGVIPHLPLSGVVALYGGSSLAVQVVTAAARAGALSAPVVVFDAAPRFAGASALAALAAAGVPAVRCDVGDAGVALRGVGILLLCAATVFGDGSSLCEAGAGVLAVVAAHVGVRTVLLSESFKLCDRVVLDGGLVNERWGGGAPAKVVPPPTPAPPPVKKGGKAPPPPPSSIPWVTTGVGSDAPVVGGGWAWAPPVPDVALVYDLVPARVVGHIVTERGGLAPREVLGVVRGDAQY